MKKNNMQALYIITNAGFADDIVEVARSVGISGATFLSARGEGRHHQSILGISVDTEKDIIICIADKELVNKCMTAIKEAPGIMTSTHAVCFAIPIAETVGLFDSDEG